MANAVKFETLVDEGDLLTTELNSLANAARSNAGTELANQTNKDQYAYAVINADPASAFTAGGYFNLYMLTAPDGTNYMDGSSTVAPAKTTLVASVDVRADANAHRLETPLFMLKPGKTKFILENQTGQALPSSGNTLEVYSLNDEIQ